MCFFFAGAFIYGLKQEDEQKLEIMHLLYEFHVNVA